MESVEFPGATGRRLAGVLHIPEGAVADEASGGEAEGRPRGSVLLAHCFTCSKDIHTMTRLARGVAEAGYVVLRFDFTGLGESGGEFTESTVSANVGDLTSAAQLLIERGYGPCAMLGHSLGGAAALLAASRVHTVRSVAVLNSPSEPSHIRRLFAAREDVIRREGEAVVEIGGRPFPISEQFLDDLGTHDQLEHVRDLDRPLLVLHAVGDRVVEVSEGERIFAAAGQPKAFVALPDADHLLSRRNDAEHAVRLLTAWLDLTL